VLLWIRASDSCFIVETQFGFFIACLKLQGSLLVRKNEGWILRLWWPDFDRVSIGWVLRGQGRDSNSVGMI